VSKLAAAARRALSAFLEELAHPRLERGEGRGGGGKGGGVASRRALVLEKRRRRRSSSSGSADVSFVVAALDASTSASSSFTAFVEISAPLPSLALALEPELAGHGPVGG
jgi:hypothetical protein